MKKNWLKPDPWGDLEQELLAFTVLAKLFLETDALEDSDRVMYLGDRVIEHAGRANAAFREMLKARKATPPQSEEGPPAPLSSAEKRALLARLERNL